MCTLILLNLSRIHNLKSSPLRDIELEIIYHTQFVGIFIIYLHTKFHFLICGHEILNIMIACFTFLDYYHLNRMKKIRGITIVTSSYQPQLW
jgi:hypothetical protein